MTTILENVYHKHHHERRKGGFLFSRLVCLFLFLIITFPSVFIAAETWAVQPKTRFVVFGHVYEDYDALRQSIKKVNALNPDFVVFLGDTLNSRTTTWDELLAITKNITAPVYFVPGIVDQPEKRGFVRKTYRTFQL